MQCLRIQTINERRAARRAGWEQGHGKSASTWAQVCNGMIVLVTFSSTLVGTLNKGAEVKAARVSCTFAFIATVAEIAGHLVLHKLANAKLEAAYRSSPSCMSN